MMAKILEGKTETRRILDEVAAGVTALARVGKKALLAAVQANDHPGADWYAKALAGHCREHGVEHRLIRLSSEADESELVGEIEKTSAEPEVSGIILFTPLPPGVSHLRLAEALTPEKDAEGIHPANLGKLVLSARVSTVPCTAMAALELIKAARPDLSGARALVIGRSATVGKPLSLLLLAENATVTIAHTRSDLRFLMPEFEVVAAAAGASGSRWRAYEKKWLAWKKGEGERPAPPDLSPLVTMNLVRRGAVVIDVGDNNLPVGLDSEGGPVLDARGQPAMRHAGDVDFAKVAELAGFITKPQGSVGPLTNAFLLRNVVRAALAANNLEPR
ncbi:MAG: bifunctional 5,10-methylenetetrahydrofolate dehydrogenase/5,10-methenyltetrahydrofolate cyclohydrolase [Planctomycetes bacterium]|nr:bifunctional 5,10-methylenetetrahydrofolate dehydrogenase/5,10-methenyltetrahydrofolate cyclohydrolase [Planctomycetota bacterium]